MEYTVLITVKHDGKTIKPGGVIDLKEAQAAPLIRGGFLGQLATKKTDSAAVADTAVKLVDALQAVAGKNEAGATANAEADVSATEPASDLARLIAAIATLDPAKADLFTGSGKPKTEILAAVDGIDFAVTAPLRDQAWDQFQKQQSHKSED